MQKGTVSLNTSVIETENGSEHIFKIDFFVYEKDNIMLAYCPALDLCSSGETFNDAINNFYECFQLYIETSLEAGTLKEDLSAHGWKLTKVGIKPPKTISALKKPEVIKIINDYPFTKVSVIATIPPLA